jgi:hypothetical protein
MAIIGPIATQDAGCPEPAQENHVTDRDREVTPECRKLWHIADPSPCLGGIPTKDAHLTHRRPMQPEYHLEEGALPTRVRAHQAEEFTLLDVEVDGLQHQRPTVAERDVLQLNRMTHEAPPRSASANASATRRRLFT